MARTNRARKAAGHEVTAGRPGFTLVELLVVIGIIAILIAILLPTIQGARVAAKRTACSARIRELASACVLYLGDYKQFPPATHFPLTPYAVPKFQTFELINGLAKYAGYRPIPATTPLGDVPLPVQCPFMAEIDLPSIRGPVTFGTETVVMNGYVYCARLNEPGHDPGAVLLKPRSADAKGRRRAVLWADDVTWYDGQGLGFLPLGPACYAYMHYNHGASFNGTGYANVDTLLGAHSAYSDGSVEWKTPADLGIRGRPHDESASYKIVNGGRDAFYVWF